MGQRKRCGGGMMPLAVFLLLTALLPLAAGVSGCRSGAVGASNEPTRDNFKGDPSKMTPDQRKQMEAAMHSGKPPVNAPIPK